MGSQTSNEIVAIAEKVLNTTYGPGTTVGSEIAGREMYLALINLSADVARLERDAQETQDAWQYLESKGVSRDSEGTVSFGPAGGPYREQPPIRRTLRDMIDAYVLIGEVIELRNKELENMHTRVGEILKRVSRALIFKIYSIEDVLFEINREWQRVSR